MSAKSTGEQKPIRLLLVDDEKGYADVLIKRMSRRNIEVTSALSGSDAIRVLRGQNFDAAVLDLKMEDMDGIEILKIFKKMDPQMPVIILTGHGSETAARQGIELGAFDYLTKPCNLTELIRKIRMACGKESETAETA
jgi:DNA-binding NtrC family response regulator